MPPLIVSQAHKKNVLSLGDFFLEDEYKILSRKEVVEEPAFKFSISIAIENTGTAGLIEIKFVNESLLVGNVNFKIVTEEYAHLVESSVAQISSAFVLPQFRGFKLVTRAYENLCDLFCVVSDNLQTCDGAALWRYSIPKLDNIDVRLIQNSLTHPEYILGSDGGEPMIFDIDSCEYEKIIWSAEDGVAYQSARENVRISCALGMMSRDVVLIAVKNGHLTH